MGTNALESYNLVESKGALLNIDAPRPVEKTGGGNFILFLKCETIQNQRGRNFFFIFLL